MGLNGGCPTAGLKVGSEVSFSFELIFSKKLGNH